MGGVNWKQEAAQGGYALFTMLGLPVLLYMTLPVESLFYIYMVLFALFFLTSVWVMCEVTTAVGTRIYGHFKTKQEARAAQAAKEAAARGGSPAPLSPEADVEAGVPHSQLQPQPTPAAAAARAAPPPAVVVATDAASQPAAGACDLDRRSSGGSSAIDLEITMVAEAEAGKKADAAAPPASPSPDGGAAAAARQPSPAPAAAARDDRPPAVAATHAAAAGETSPAPPDAAADAPLSRDAPAEAREQRDDTRAAEAERKRAEQQRVKSMLGPRKWGGHPNVVIIIPALFDNEVDILDDTLQAYTGLRYPGRLCVMLCTNRRNMPPQSVYPLRNKWHGKTVNGIQFEVHDVPRSKSKAQNVNYALEIIPDDVGVIGVYDADHQPLPDSVVTATGLLEKYDVVQGHCAIRNIWVNLLTLIVAVEFEDMYNVAHEGRSKFYNLGVFGGSNGYWRAPLLKALEFNHKMLTEDIDSSMRVLVNGGKIGYGYDLISTELAPEEFCAFYKQRLRWAQGWLQVSMKYLLPLMLRSKSLRRRLCAFFLFFWREAFVYLTFHPMLVWGLYIARTGEMVLNWLFFGFFLVFASIMFLRVGIIYALANGPVKAYPSCFFVFAALYPMYVIMGNMIHVAAHYREIVNDQTWNTTSRSSGGGTASLAAASSVTLTLTTAPSDNPPDALGVEGEEDSSTAGGGDAAAAPPPAGAARLEGTAAGSGPVAAEAAHGGAPAHSGGDGGSATAGGAAAKGARRVAEAAAASLPRPTSHDSGDGSGELKLHMEELQRLASLGLVHKQLEEIETCQPNLRTPSPPHPAGPAHRRTASPP